MRWPGHAGSKQFFPSKIDNDVIKVFWHDLIEITLSSASINDKDVNPFILLRKCSSWCGFHLNMHAEWMIIRGTKPWMIQQNKMFLNMAVENGSEDNIATMLWWMIRGLYCQINRVTFQWYSISPCRTVRTWKFNFALSLPALHSSQSSRSQKIRIN